MTDNERTLIDKFVAREILTGVDGGLRRAVESLRAKLKVECARSAKLHQVLEDFIDDSDWFPGYAKLVDAINEFELSRNVD